MSTRLKALAAALLALLIGGASAFASSTRADANTYTVTAYFEKSIGLFSHSDVRVLGVPVGKVTSVEPSGDRVKVTLKLDSQISVPRSASATIVPISLISDRYVQLSPPFDGGPKLRDGDVIDQSHTTIPVELDDLLGSLKKLLDALESGKASDPGALGAAIDNLSKTLDGTGEDLSKTLGGGGTIGGIVVDHGIELDSSVVHFSRVLKALAERQSDIATLNSRLARSFGAVADEQASLDGALKNLSTLTEELGTLVRDHRRDLEADLVTLAKTTQAAVRHQDSIIEASDWLPVLTNSGEYESGRPAHSSDGISHPADAQNNGPTHLDVRDAHYGVCPDVCALLPLFRATSTDLPRAPASSFAVPPAPQGPQATPSPSAGPIPIPTVTTPPLLRLMAAGEDHLPQRSVTKPRLSDVAESWFRKLGGLVAHFLGERP